MVKKYVFWRTPTGQPYKRDDGKYAPTSLLEQIGKSATINDDGSISWPFSDYFRNEFTIRSMITVIDNEGNELNEIDTMSIASETITAVIKKQGKKQPITPRDFITHADRLAAKYFRKSVNPYVLVTSLSIKDLPSQRIHIHDCEITSLASRRKYKIPDALANSHNGRQLIEHLKSTKYLFIKVKTSGHSAFEASERALEALSLLRGMWTLICTHGQRAMRIGASKRDTIGVIHIGPVHTLHQLDGSPAIDLYWYEPGYTCDKKIFTPSNNWDEIKKRQQYASRKLKTHPFGLAVKRLLMRYAEALDQSNLDLTFLQMWSILEKITDTIGANYDETINRVSWIYKDRKAAKEELSYLRVRRNQYVHSAKNSEDVDQIAYSIKTYVDAHLLRVISNEFRVSSLSEYGKFLSLPINITTLEKNREQINLALKLLKSG